MGLRHWPDPGIVAAAIPADRGHPMNFHFEINALLALIAGILILIMPRLLNYVVALYLIIIGILGLVR